jgi:hypothetical protein
MLKGHHIPMVGLLEAELQAMCITLVNILTLNFRLIEDIHNLGDPLSSAPEEYALRPDGRVMLSIVDQPPHSLTIDETNSVIRVPTPCYPTMGPILKHLVRSYSPVESKVYITLSSLFTKSLNLELNKQLYVFDKQEWIMLGRYWVAVEDNADSYWKEEENGMLMKILVVSSSNARIEVILTSIQENDPADVLPSSPLVASAIPPSFHSRSLSGSCSAPASRSSSAPRSVSVSASSSISGSCSPSVASSATVAAGGPAYKKFSKEGALYSPPPIPTGLLPDSRIPTGLD